MDPNDRLIDRAFMDIAYGATSGAPGLFWPERHAEICKAAERVTRQQRRQAERAAAKNRYRIGGRKR